MRKTSRKLRLLAGGGTAALIAAGLSACGSTTTTSAASHAPITIGVSVSLTGDFSAEGKALEQGYNLWAADVNSHGGILGRKVQFKYLNDNSSTTQVATNYQDLITRDKVNIVFGPFSSLLTIPALTITDRYGYAFEAPAGGGPAVFAEKSPDFVFVQPTTVVNTMVSAAEWLASLPKSERPKTAAYAADQGPFNEPEIQKVESILQAHGIKTVYSKIYPAETTDYLPIALGIIHSKAQAVLLGTHVPSATAFVQAFVQQHYNPKALVFTSGPQSGTQFLNGIGGTRFANGLMVPAGWWYGASTYQNQQFVSQYLKKYGGTASEIPTTAAEAYSVGQVFQEAADHMHSINNAKLIKALHAYQFKTIQGPMKFNSIGAPNGQSFVLQWVGSKLEPVYPKTYAEAKPLFPKPNWP